MTDLRVPVAVGRVGELERDERFARRTIETAPFDEQALDEIVANQTREELLKDDGLIMPAQLAGRALEHVRVRHAAGAHAVDETVVGLNEREMHLRHEDMGVVPWIADDRGALAVAQDVLTIRAGQELGRVVPLKQVWVADGAVPVQALEIQLR